VISNHILDRRSVLKFLALSPFLATEQDEKLPPVRAITRGPKHHWFGYYDKLQFDPTGRYVLGMEVDFEGRPPKPTDGIKVGMVDLENGDRWIELGESHAWCWQQGCMLQWLPRSKTEIIWNDREGDRFVSHVLDVKTRKKRTLPGPIYCISPDARWALRPDFRRINDLRPGYGYTGIPDPNKDVLAPRDSGIWRMDLQAGDQTFLFSVADIAKVPMTRGGWRGAKHYFNHLLFSPDGSRFIFFHLWAGEQTGASPLAETERVLRGGKVYVQHFFARMFTVNPDGKELYVVTPGGASHFWWRDPQHILSWAWHPSHGERFYLFEDRTQRAQVIGLDVMTEDGHCSYLPHKYWILCDTYPDKQRNQSPYLYNVETRKRYWLGHFYSPPQYEGSWRVDTHPRFSPDGRKVVIDSPHGGNGRQLYMIDISQLAKIDA
jgi:WD40-like Beta Propeller Repeat